IALIDVQGETASPVASGDAGGQPDAGARAATDQPRAPPGAPSVQTQAIGQLPAPPDAGQPQTTPQRTSDTADAFGDMPGDRTQTLDASDRPENFTLAPQTPTDAEAEAQARGLFDAGHNDMFGGQTQAATEQANQQREQAQAAAPAPSMG